MVGVEVCGRSVVGGIEECGRGGVWLEGWRCTVGGVEVRSGKGGGVWEGRKCVGGVEVCGRGGVLVGWRSVGRVEVCGRVEMHGGRGGGVWEGWSVGGVGCVGVLEVCWNE